MILDIFNQLEATSKRTEKTEILTEHKDNETLQEVFRLAYTPTINFNIKQIPEYQSGPTDGYTLDKALRDVYQFFVVEGDRGHRAQNRLASVLSNLIPADAEVLERVMKRDLRIGCTSSTANKVWKGLVREKPCMLASSYKEKLVDAILKNPNGAYAELKADGARCMAMVHEDGTVEFESRNGKPYHGLTRLEQVVKSLGAEGFVIDGELVYAPDGLANVEDRAAGNGIVTKASKGKISDEEQANIVFQVWDIVPIDVYNGVSNELNMPYKRRKMFLTELVNARLGMGVDRPIEPIPFQSVYTKEEASAVYRSYVNQGLEGIILKDPDALWEDTRSKSLVKYKEVHDADMYIVGFTEGTGKNAGSLGSIQIRSACGMIECSVGTGFSKKQRDDIWARRDELLETVIEVTYNAIVKSKTSDTYAFFLPVFVELRFDKDVANTLDEIYDRQAA